MGKGGESIPDEEWERFLREAEAGTEGAPEEPSALRTQAGQAPYRSTDRGAGWSRVRGLGNDAAVVADRASARTFYSLSGGTLHASTDGGATFTTLASVRSASALGFGKAAAGAGYQALYLIGTVKDVTGVFRSTDKGATWLRVNDDAHQWGGIGDPDTFGRVYAGTNGRGLQYGDPS
ncbi:hypothetical protein [Streptomyces sp. NPDC001388]|uniref:hypothetical protein n=1 Tax=unclassified Streptomyces TaxID=2593676 RepID=UPI0036A8B39C